MQNIAPITKNPVMKTMMSSCSLENWSASPILGLPFASGDSELAHAGLTQIASETVKPPRIMCAAFRVRSRVDQAMV